MGQGKSGLLPVHLFCLNMGWLLPCLRGVHSQLNIGLTYFKSCPGVLRCVYAWLFDMWMEVKRRPLVWDQDVYKKVWDQDVYKKVGQGFRVSVSHSAREHALGNSRIPSILRCT